jgi:hypothetical protein
MDILSIGLSGYDVALIILCPLGAMIGSFAHAIVETIDLKGPPTNESDMRIASKELQELRGIWLGLRLMLGAILGLIIGLYFIGAIQETPSTIAKVMALSILLGYAAPKIWEAQDKIVTAKINKIVNSEISQNNTSA